MQLHLGCRSPFIARVQRRTVFVLVSFGYLGFSCKSSEYDSSMESMFLEESHADHYAKEFALSSVRSSMREMAKPKHMFGMLLLSTLSIIPSTLKVRLSSPFIQGRAAGLRSKLSGIDLQAASSLLTALFPGDKYWNRHNAVDRHLGEAAQLGSNIYGEFDLGFFASLVDRAISELPDGAAGRVFVDVGSGCGRLVFAAAALWPFARCIGIERVSVLHQMAVNALAAAKEVEPMCEFFNANASDVLCGDGALVNADVIFAYSSAFESSDGASLVEFSELCGTCLRAGTLVITTDKWLTDDRGPWRFRLVDKLEGPNRETFGSTGYIWEIMQSAS